MKTMPGQLVCNNVISYFVTPYIVFVYSYATSGLDFWHTRGNTLLSRKICCNKWDDPFSKKKILFLS